MLEIYYVMSSGKTHGAYRGANSVFLNQLFQYNYKLIDYLEIVQKARSAFCRCSHVTKSPGFHQSPGRMRSDWSEPGLFVPQ